MSGSVAKVIVVGNLGRDPEMRYTASGQAVTSFSVAASRTYTNNAGERVDETTWFKISTWGKQAENCNQFLKKGSKVYIEGRLVPDKSGNPRVWTRQDGAPAASFEVNASEVVFLSSRTNGNGEQTEESVPMGDTDENIPF